MSDLTSQLSVAELVAFISTSYSIVISILYFRLKKGDDITKKIKDNFTKK